MHPILLNQKASHGRTIIEKFEQESNVSFAIVLLTPDDEGRKKGMKSFENRAGKNRASDHLTPISIDQRIFLIMKN